MSDMNKEAKCETRGEVMADGHQVTSMAGGVFRLRQGYWRTATGAAGRRKTKLAGQRPALPAVGARMDVNLAKLKPIKVDQGEFYMTDNLRMRTVPAVSGTFEKNLCEPHGPL
jgi:hypothetical protein